MFTAKPQSLIDVALDIFSDRVDRAGLGFFGIRFRFGRRVDGIDDVDLARGNGRVDIRRRG